MSRGAPKAPISYEGAYDSARTYLPRQLVTFDGGMYLSVATSTGVTPNAAAVTPWLPTGAPYAPTGAELFPAALTVSPGGIAKLPLDELDEWDGGTVPSWITQDTSTNIVHITEAGVYAHNLEVQVNNTTNAVAVVLFRCSTTNGSGRAYQYVPAGESRTVTFDRVHPYFGGELGGDQLLYVEVHATGTSGTVAVAGLGNTIWAIAKIA